MLKIFSYCVQAPKLFTVLSLFAIVGVFFYSCRKEVDIVPASNPETSEIEKTGGSRGQNNKFGWTYYPNPNGYYSYSIPGETKKGFGGTYNGGFMKANFVEISGSYYVRLTPYNGSRFGVAGTAYIKVGSLYGQYDSNTASFSSNDTYVDVPVSINLNKNNTSKLGAMNLYPVVITTSPTLRFFTHPILIWTDPFFYSTTQTGALHGRVDNVEVIRQPGGCVRFCKNYYSNVYGMDLDNMGNAGDWWTTASNYGLVVCNNGDSIPHVGDIVCWTGGTSGDFDSLGHIAIIFEVQSDKVKIAHQGNVGTPIGREIPRNGNTLTNVMSGLGYTLKGIIRKED